MASSQAVSLRLAVSLLILQLQYNVLGVRERQLSHCLAPKSLCEDLALLSVELWRKAEHRSQQLVLVNTKMNESTRRSNRKQPLFGQRFPRRICPVPPQSGYASHLHRFWHDFRSRLPPRKRQDRSAPPSEGNSTTERGRNPPSRFSNLLLMPLDKVDSKKPLASYGMDSMIAAEYWSLF